MSRSLIVLLILSVLTPCQLQASKIRPARRVSKEFLESIVDDNPNPLPRDLAPGEVFIPLTRDPREILNPPEGEIHTPAEYEENEGLLISWGSFNSLLTSMVVAVTTGTDAVMYIVVSNASQQTSASSTLSAAGANMNQVQFITYSTDSVWMRDYGPRFIDESGERAIIDHDYNRPRPNDNAFPDFLASLWGGSECDIPLTHGGGNFHLFADGKAYMTELILDENSGLTAADVQNDFLQYAFLLGRTKRETAYLQKYR